MDKYEYKVKLEQIEKMAAKKDYVTAAKIADGIDWRKVKSVSTLSMIADVYEAAGQLDACYELLGMVYDRSPIGRSIVYRMAEIAIKMHDFEEAISLYKEFVKIAPHDLNKYILKYKIYRERGSSVEDQITILEEFKSHEYDEKWAYELACRYKDAGKIEECIEACDELILWFSEGEYVLKALELKMQYQELTAAQQAKYENHFAQSEESYEDMLESFLEGEIEISEPEAVPEEIEEEALEESEESEESEENIFVEESLEDAAEVFVAEVPEEAVQQQEASVDTEDVEDEETPQVSMINVNKFSTINLQEELAKNLEELLACTEAAQNQETEAAEETVEEEKGDTQEFIRVKEVVIEPEEEIATEQPVAEPEEKEETSMEVEAEIENKVEPEVEAETKIEEVIEEEPVQEEVQPERNLSETGEIHSELLKYISEPQKPKMEELLRTEEDGQMTLAISGEGNVDKQITGQMTIGEILEAWEEKKRQIRAQIEAAEAKKPAVLFETGEITGLLEDFIPKTPKEVAAVEEPVVEEPETEKIVETEEIVESEEIAEAEEPAEVEPEEIAEAEEPAETEALPEENWEETTELEDDLPQDIDLEDALEAFLETSIVEAPTEEVAVEEVVEETAEEAVTEETVEASVEEEPAEEEITDAETAEAFEEEPVPEKADAGIGQNTAAMLDAIERALALEIAPVEKSGSYLTEEQEQIFAYFTSVNGMKKQLIHLLNEENDYAGKEESKEGNLIITGHPGNGKTTLAIDIVKAIQKQRKIKGAKLAKVSGDGFNKKNPEEVIKKLGGGALIIERAGSLKSESVELLSAAMEGYTGGLLVILEDSAEEIKRLMKKHEGFAKKFNRSIDIPIFSNDELVAFGKSYAEEQEYFFDEMAVLALYDCIGVRQTSEHVVNIAEVKEFIDEAIAHAEKKSKGFFAKLSKKRVDEYGNKLLLEEDFNC